MRTAVMALLSSASCAAPLAEVRDVNFAPDAMRVVHVKVEPPHDVGGYWGRKRLGTVLSNALAGELEHSLRKAGYSVVGRSDEKRRPTDVVLRIATAIDGSTNALRTKSSLEVLHRGRLVAAVSVRTPLADGRVMAERFPTVVAQRLVDALSQSVRLANAKIEPIAPPTKRPTVVASFGVRDKSAQLDDVSRRQLGDYLIVRATQVLGYRFVPEETIRAAMRGEKREAYAACFDARCQIELGRALAAQKTLVTELIRVGDHCVLTALVFDLTTETTEAATTVDAPCDEVGLLKSADRLVHELAGV